MTRCNHERDNLKAYLDGELPITTRLAIRWRLLRCGDCRREIQEMTDLSQHLKAADAGTLDDALRTKILNSMPDAAPDVPQNLPPFRSRLQRRKVPLYAFGASATALVGWFVLYPALNSAKQTDATQTAALPNAAEQSARIAMDSGAVKSAPASDSADATSIAPSEKTNSPAPQIQEGIAASDRASAGFVPPAASAPRRAAKPSAISPEDTDRKVHREASLTLEVDKTEAKSETISTLTNTAGGYVANDELHTEEDGTKTASLTLKVPVAQFEAFLAQISHLGDVKAKSLSGEDITEKTSDQEQTARVVGDDAKDLEAKLQRLRHASRRDEESLRQLKIREAQAQAHLKLLRNLAALADITVELREKPKAEPVKPQTGGFINDLNETAHNAITAFSQAARLPIILLIWGVVYLPLFLALLVAYRFFSRFWTRFMP